MVTKGEQTHDMILAKAAEVFNRQGYFGAALSDLMAATGLEKGGIYNHFKSKDDLALQAFDYAVSLIRQELTTALQGKSHPVDRLQAVIAVYKALAEGVPLEGGCPILNTAIESDDTHPQLRRRARQAMDGWLDFVRATVRKGVERGEIRPEVDPDQLATLILSTLEGGVMLTGLYGDTRHMAYVVEFLTQYLDRQVRA